MHTILWANRKRAGKKFVNFMLALLLMCNIQRLVSSYFQIKFSPELDNIQKTIILKRNLEFLKQRAVFSAMFCCPSMSYFIVMLLGFTVSMFILSFGLVGLSNQEFMNTLFELPAYCMLCFAIFYILQKRELKSFLRE